MKSIPKHLTGLASLVLLYFLILLMPSQLYARDATFSWTANPEPLTGYRLYYKTGEDGGAPYNSTGLIEGGSPIPVDRALTAFTVTGLSDNETYHFVLTALNGEEESDYSTVATVYSDPAPAILGMILL